MLPHQNRVVTEHRELNVRLGRLRGFMSTDLFPSLPQEEQDMMRQQADAMQAYSDMLQKRIEYWKVNAL